MRRLHILMPMGGLGSRFSAQGWSTPKPLIPVDGTPMFLKALGSFAGLAGPRTVTAIYRRETDQEGFLSARIRAALADVSIVLLDGPTRGAVETCLAGAAHLAADDGVVVLDCDLCFACPAYLEAIAAVLAGRSDADGLLLTFPSSAPRYSYAQIAEGRVVRTAEKEPISPHAVVGAYFFSRADAFLGAARTLLARPLATEYYTSYLYNILIAGGARIAAVPVTGYASFGTPEELAAHLAAGAAAGPR